LEPARSAVWTTPESAREPSAQGKTDPAQQLREAKDILNQAARFATIACACGLRIKLPPDFNQKEITCPRCGRVHEVPAPELMAAAAAMQTVRIPRVKTPPEK